MGFFDDLSDTLFSAGKTVSEKARNTADVARTQYEIKETELKIRDLYVEFGKKYYKEHKDEDTDEFNELKAAKSKLDDLKQEVNAYRGTRVCPKCGAVVSKNAQFCSKCGADLSEAASDDTETED